MSDFQTLIKCESVAAYALLDLKNSTPVVIEVRAQVLEQIYNILSKTTFSSKDVNFFAIARKIEHSLFFNSNDTLEAYADSGTLRTRIMNLILDLMKR
jgi:hypothetical protein